MDSDSISAQPNPGLPYGRSGSFNITVHLPAPEQNLTFRDVDCSTNIGQLKLMIHNALPNRPALNRIRIIYRGRFAASDGESLVDVIGVESIRNSIEHNLHAVIRPSPSEDSSTPGNRSSGSISNPFRPSSIPAPSTLANTSSTNPFRTPTISRPQSQPQTPPIISPHANPGSPQRSPFPSSFPPLPHDINQIINQQLQAAQQAAQQAVSSSPHLVSHGHRHHHHQTPANPPGSNGNGEADGEHASNLARTSNIFQETIARQQQQRAAANAHNGSLPLSFSATQNGISDSSSNPQNNLQTPTPGQTHTQTSNSRIYQEGVGPNGAHWSVTIDRMGPINMDQPPNEGRDLPRQSVAPGTFDPQPFTPWNLNVPGHMMNRTSSSRGATSEQNANEIRNHISSLQEETENMLALLDRGSNLGNDFTASLESSSEQRDQDILHRQAERIARITSQLNDRYASSVNVQDQSRQFSTLVSGPNQPQTQQNSPLLSTMANDPQNWTSNVFRPPTTTQQHPRQSQAGEQIPERPPPNPITSNLPEIFLLTSPEGSYGLVTSGMLSQLTSPMARSNHSAFLERLHSQYITNRQALAELGMQMYIRNRTSGLGPQSLNSSVQMQSGDAGSRHRHRQHRHHRHHRHERAQAPVNGENAQDNARRPNQGPIAQRLGLLQNVQVRNDRFAVLAGHLWLALRAFVLLYLIAGGGGWRRPILIIILGALVYLAQNGIFRNPAERVRRLFELLLPLPEERRREQARNEARANEVEIDHGEQRQRFPNPEDTARRLMQERNLRVPLWVQDQMIIIGRGFALFLASLWPGLGERMAAAREERLRQDQEEQQQDEQEGQASHQNVIEEQDTGTVPEKTNESETPLETSEVGDKSVAEYGTEHLSEKPGLSRTTSETTKTMPERSQEPSHEEPSWSFAQESPEASAGTSQSPPDNSDS